MTVQEKKQPKNTDKNQSGQGIVEYLLILSFALFTSLLVLRGIRGASDRGILLLGGQLERDLKTGKTPVSLGWKN